jgi:hypothetical protein
MLKRLAFGISAAALFACGGPFNTGDNSAPGTDTTVPPQVTVVAPGDQQGFQFANEDDQHHGDDDFDVEVEVEHANLADPGKCNKHDHCGHLVLLVDGMACGNPNSLSSSKKFKGKFGKCVTVSGPHQIVVQLVDDQGNVIAATQPVTVNVTFKGHDANDDQGDHDAGDDHGGDDGGSHG